MTLNFLSLALSIALLCLVFVFLKNRKLKKTISQNEYYCTVELLDKETIIDEYQHKRLNIYKSLLLLTTQKEDTKLLEQINKVVFGDERKSLDWDTFFLFVNEMYDDFATNLWKSFPNLSFDQINFCCLIIANFSMPEIIRLLDIKGNSIRMKRMGIREKLGISGETDLLQFLLGFAEKRFSTSRQKQDKNVKKTA